MNESLVKYLAGLLDADGSLSLKFRRADNKPECYYPSLMLTLHSSAAVDKAGFVESLPEVTGMGTFNRYGTNGRFYRWDVAKSAHLEMLLPRLVKHMCVKAKHWNWMLELWREIRGAPCSKDEWDNWAVLAKQSRIERVGPLRPKNHPTWAWLAGYLDGDGYYRHAYLKKKNCWQMQTGAVAHKNDAAVLRFIQNSFGGSIYEHGQCPEVLTWRRSLGVGDRSFALQFLPNVTKHARLKKHKIDQMIHHHQQRLSAPSPKG